MQDDCGKREERVCQLIVSLGGYEIKRNRFVEFKVTWAQDRIMLVVPLKAQTGAVRIVRVDSESPDKSYDIIGPVFTVTEKFSPHLTITIPTTVTLVLNQTVIVTNYQNMRITLNKTMVYKNPSCLSLDCPILQNQPAARFYLSSPGGCGQSADRGCLGPPGFSQEIIMAEGTVKEVLGLRFEISGITDKTAILKISFILSTIPPQPTTTENQQEGGGAGQQAQTTDTHSIQIRESAQLLQNNNIDALLAEIKELRNQVREQEVKIKYLERLTNGVQELSQKTEERLNTFISYGVDDNTKRLGEGERAAVLYSYKQAFKKLPENDTEIEDAIRIANGRFPQERNEAAENRAQEQFKKIYKRAADLNNANDNAAVVVMAYGLRQKPENRNLDSERAGIATFNHIYKHIPQTTEEWNIMQGITYSGAVTSPN